MSSLLPFVATPVDAIGPTVSRLHEAFSTLKTHPLAFREEQLGRLYWAVRDNEQRLFDALKADFGKPVTETFMTEVVWLQNEILSVMKNLKKWAADETIETQWILRFTSSPRMRKEPMGTILIIGASNYPVQLTLHPLIGAIAGGNTAIVKPSELTPNTSALITQMIESLDHDFYAVANGGVDVTTKLLEQKFDKIVYTGSTHVGRIVAAAAAKHLTPVLLELGGLNPTFVMKSADVKIAAKRIAWGKAHNAGQVCIGPDYILIHPALEAEFVTAFISALETFFPNGAQVSEDFSHIINDRNFHRIKNLLDSTKGSILYGGSTNEETRFIAPTLVKVTDLNDSLLSEEIFGPVIPMMVVERVDEMISLAKRIGDCPLGLYIFSADKKEQELVLMSVRSGGASINDVMLHASDHQIPFGGVGESGHGKYRGRDTFDSFVHKRPILRQPLWVERELNIRYPPYTPEKLKALRKFSGNPTPSFGRDGKTLPQQWWQWVLLLGAPNKRGGIFRYLTLLAFGAMLVKIFPGAKA